jgi:hypothetical protein
MSWAALPVEASWPARVEGQAGGGAVVTTGRRVVTGARTTVVVEVGVVVELVVVVVVVVVGTAGVGWRARTDEVRPAADPPQAVRLIVAAAIAARAFLRSCRSMTSPAPSHEIIVGRWASWVIGLLFSSWRSG